MFKLRYERKLTKHAPLRGLVSVRKIGFSKRSAAEVLRKVSRIKSNTGFYKKLRIFELKKTAISSERTSGMDMFQERELSGQ